MGKRFWKTIIVLLIAFLIPTLATAYSLSIENGISWLSANQNPDGSWGSNADLAILDTSTVLDTLKVLNMNSPVYSNGVTWLSSQAPISNDFISRKIVSLYMAGMDVSADLSALVNSRRSDGGWGGDADSTSMINDTALALQVLKSVNYPDQNVISSALGYLLSTQNADGGWGFYQGDKSNIYMTAMVSMTLQQFSQTSSIATAINKATSYLIVHQNPDGGFGSSTSSESTIYETALAYIALVGVTTDNTVLGNAINYLLSTQSPDGSWLQDPYSTALALRALANVKPNLSISANDITFSNPTPTVGDTITITANVKNTGPAVAENISIQVFNNDPSSCGILIGETIIPSIPAFSAVQTSISWTIPSPAAYTIFVKIDPLNTIDELDETDNIASQNITSATLPDLSITSADITFTPSAPMEGDPVTITATVRNSGETGATNVTLDIYDGDPLSGGILIGNTTISSIGPGGSAAVQFTGTFTSGSHNIYSVIDKANSIAESNRANNTAMKILEVETRYIDLLVTNSDITFSPSAPVEGNIVEINASIYNTGNMGANNVLLRFYLGDPDSGGIQIASDINLPSIPVRGAALITTQWDSTGHAGNNIIYVKLDPLNTITEINELNNKASGMIKVAAKTGPDLIALPANINLTPFTPNTGDIVTITANIRNIGNRDANNVLVEFSLGDPDVGGTLIIGSQTIPFIAKGSYATAQMTWNTTGFSGIYEIYVNADPFNEIPELNETNNIAHATLEIKAPQGPDLAISSIDTTNLITATQTLVVSGTIRATIENKGNQPTNVLFEITAFENRSGTNPLTSPFSPPCQGGEGGGCNILGKVTYTTNLATGATDIIDIPLLGNILFRDNRIYVMVDSGDAITELDETNNISNTGRNCANEIPVRTIDPVEKCRWSGSNIMPEFNQVMHTPVVARLIDTNGDGLIDEKDVPAVIFSTFREGWYYGASNGVLRAIRGDNCQEIFTVTNPAYRTTPTGNIAVGDIDNDGLVEIIAPKSGMGILAFEHDGTFKWEYPYGGTGWGAISIADIDMDGKPEIIVGSLALNNDSTLKWNAIYGGGAGNPISLVADIDLDGMPELIAGNKVYNYNGTIKWWNTAILYQGYNAVANFDDDPYPEIVLVAEGGLRVWLLEHTGQIKWTLLLGQGFGGGAPTIADFDGDGKPEIGIAGSSRYAVLKADGSILWQSVTMDQSGVTSSSAFDLDGDGQMEVIYADNRYLRIFKGSTGQVLFSTPNNSGTACEYPVVADVDNDGHAEIIVAANDYAWFSFPPGATEGIHGIRVFADRNHSWVNTRAIWNQHTYHITNVNDDGTIPRYEQNNWEIYNNYRSNSILPDEILGTADITTSYITVDQINYPASVTISARIGNGGAVSHPAGVDVAFYDGDPNQGGVLIGTTKTNRALDAGDYEDVSITWNTPTPGDHIVFVVADKDNKFNECREDNNIAFASLNIGGIQSIENLPDLEISSSDITIIPPDTIEGQSSIISAIIHNIGTLGASDVVISFYDGDLQSGGILIGSVTKSYIDAGATALAEVTWDTFGQTGRNYIHIIVDPQNLITESNENNNSAIIPVDVTPPSKPDLAITSSDISFSNLNPKEGEPLTINAAIHNFGTDTSDFEVYLYDGDPASGGMLLSQKAIPQIIPFGGKVILSFEINTIGFTGSHNFYISVDPNNRVDEITETNNIGWNTLTIGSSGLSLGISTDKTLYTANENLQITVNIENRISSNRSGTLEVKILDLNDNVVSIVTNQALTLNPNENKILNYTWNTGQTFSGDYKVYCHFIEGGNVIAKADTPISISPDKTVSSKVNTDKISYSANQLVTISSTITSLSPNYIFENLTARIAISMDSPIKSGNDEYVETRTIPILTPGQLTELKTYWNTSTNPKGTYTVKLEVFEGVTILSTSTATFEILGSSDTGVGLTGTISATPNPVYQGRNETLTYTVTNRGNEDIPNLNVKVLIVNPDIQEVKTVISGQWSVNRGETITEMRTASTANLMSKTYLAILQASTPSMPSPKTLASTTFEVKPGIEVSKTIPDVKNILVWLNYSCIEDSSQHNPPSPPFSKGGLGGFLSSESEQKECINRTLIKQALNEAGVSYHIVLDKKEFETEIRNPYYTDIMILGDHNPIEDHFAEELREQVYSGKGLISSMFNRQNLDADVFGIKFKGHLSGKDYPVELIESEGVWLYAPTTFQSYGRALKIEAFNPDGIIAWILETPDYRSPITDFGDKYPGIIKRKYGEAMHHTMHGGGHVLFYAFDLGLSSENYSQFAMLLKNSLNYIHNEIPRQARNDILGAYQLVPVEIKIKSLGGAFDLRITETYPEEIKIYDPSTSLRTSPSTGKWITENPWVIDMHLEPDETKTILYYVLTPDKAGTYTLQTEVGYIENGVYNFYQSLSTNIVIGKDTVTMNGDIISALEALSVTGQERSKVDNAIRNIQNVQNRVILTTTDIEQNIHDILKAINSLLSVTSIDISNIRLLIDELLMTWESRYYLGLI